MSLQFLDFIGADYDTVRAMLIEKGIMHRIVVMNGVRFNVSQDERPERWNVTLEDGIITNITLG